MTPSIGSIVHYVSYGTPGGEYPSTCRAAIITDVGPVIIHGGDTPFQTVSLCVLNPEGMFFNQDVLSDEDAKDGGTWHWPERVE